jgi:hypothetical protein
MQISNSLGGAFPPSQGGGVPSPDLDSQIQAQRSYHQRILRSRAIHYWWFRILLLILAAVVANILAPFAVGPLALSIFKYLAFGGVAIIVLYWCVRSLKVGMFLLALMAVPLFSVSVSIKSLQLEACIPIMIVLFCALLVQSAFHVRKPFLPPLQALWPYIGMVVLAIASVIIVQFTWTHGVPKKINSNPIYYDEVLGVGTYFFPILTYMVVTTIISYWETLIQHIQHIFVVLAIVSAIVVFYEFRRLGGSVSTFRFADPHVLWMSLRGIAQFLCLGSFITYVRFLIPAPWSIEVDRINIPYFPRFTSFIRRSCYLTRFIGGHEEFYPSHRFLLKAGVTRLIYLLLTIAFLLAIFVTLQNSWWVEVLVGLLVITIICSFRLLVFYVLLIVPFTPLILIGIQKLQSIKSDDTLRLIIWVDAVRVWLKQPVLGVGPGDFWAYDQVFTLLPRIYRNCNATGLCVAHDGYLQTLGELGPIGLFLYIAASVVIIIAAVRLLRRSKMPRLFKTNIFNSILQSLGVYEYAHSEKRNDRVLAIVCLGLVAGSMAGDLFIGEFMLPPRQVSVLNVIPQVMVTWIIYGFVLYKDQVWRMARKALRFQKKRRPARPPVQTQV